MVTKHTLYAFITIVIALSFVFGLFLYTERDRTDLKLENQTLKTQIDLLKYQNQDYQKQLQSQYAFLQKLNKK